MVKGEAAVLDRSAVIRARENADQESGFPQGGVSTGRGVAR